VTQVLFLFCVLVHIGAVFALLRVRLRGDIQDVPSGSMKTAIWCYFPLSAGIPPHGRYQPHGQWRHLEVDATGRDRVYGWLLVGYHVSGVSRPGRVGHSDPQRPSTGSIWRPISRTTGGVGFCPLYRAVGVMNSELSNRASVTVTGCAWRCFPHSRVRSS
jgi:hypothetical protein